MALDKLESTRPNHPRAGCHPQTGTEPLQTLVDDTWVYLFIQQQQYLQTSHSFPRRSPRLSLHPAILPAIPIPSHAWRLHARTPIKGHLDPEGDGVPTDEPSRPQQDTDGRRNQRLGSDFAPSLGLFFLVLISLFCCFLGGAVVSGFVSLDPSFGDNLGLPPRAPSTLGWFFSHHHGRRRE